MKRKYHIQMKTQLGIRNGFLEIEIENQTVNGYIHILNHLQSFQGTIDQYGQCTINGWLVTLLNHIPYTATGTISSQSLSLCLKCNQYEIPVNGFLEA